MTDKPAERIRISTHKTRITPEAEAKAPGVCALCLRLQRKVSLLVGLLAGVALWSFLMTDREALTAHFLALFVCLAASSGLMFMASRHYRDQQKQRFWPPYVASIGLLVVGISYFIFSYIDTVCGGSVSGPITDLILHGAC